LSEGGQDDRAGTEAALGLGNAIAGADYWAVLKPERI
jgi:hypothetical protein